MLVANQKSPYLFFEIHVHVPFSDDTCVIHMYVYTGKIKSYSNVIC